MRVPRTILYYTMVILLVATGYLVVRAGDNWGGFDFTSKPEPQVPGEDVEAIFDDNDPAEWQLSDGEEFFIEYRLERERVRSRELEILQQMINNPNISGDSKLEAESKLLHLQGLMETELLVENAIKAQGYRNAVLIIQNQAALVVVSATELSRPEVALIAQIVSNSTDISPAKINITVQSDK